MLSKYHAYIDIHNKIVGKEHLNCSKYVATYSTLNNLLSKCISSSNCSFPYDIYDEKKIHEFDTDTLNKIYNCLEKELNYNIIGITLKHKYDNITRLDELKGSDKQLYDYLALKNCFKFNLDVVIIEDNNNNGKHTHTFRLLEHNDITDITNIYVSPGCNNVCIQLEQQAKREWSGEYGDCEYLDGKDIYTNIVLLISNNHA